MKTQNNNHENSTTTAPLNNNQVFRSLIFSLTVLLATVGYASAEGSSQTGGTWTAVATPFPGSGAGSALLLTDGRVLVHSEQSNLSDWYTLTPDAYGNYVNGTWTKVASMTTLPANYCYAPLFFASAVLPDGRVIVEGGEDNYPPSPCSPSGDTNKGAIFDPKASGGLGQWTSVSPPTSWSSIGDAQSAILPNGSFMLANCCSTQEALLSAPYNPGTNPWTTTGMWKHDWNDEEGWTLLPSPTGDALLLTVDANVTTSTCGSSGSELYINGYWFCYGNTPVQLWDSGHELGPAVLRPDGKVFQAGAVPHTAIFDIYGGWQAGPDFPTYYGEQPLDIADGPAALLPNGNVLMMASPGEFKTDSHFFELTYNTDIYGNYDLVEVSRPPNAPYDSSFYGHMVELPTGQILLADYSTAVEIYTPTNRTWDESWAPNVTSCGIVCTIHNSVTNTISGTGFNGMSQGAAYGDDYQSATNYPLVRLRDGASIVGLKDTVYYCRTHDHSTMGVATGDLPVSTSFDCPNVPTGFTGILEVVANGIPSPVKLVSVVP